MFWTLGIVVIKSFLHLNAIKIFMSRFARIIKTEKYVLGTTRIPIKLPFHNVDDSPDIDVVEFDVCET